MLRSIAFFCWVLAGLTLLAGCGGERRVDLEKTFGAKQLLVVTTSDWETTNGLLRVFERDGGKWKPAFEGAIEVQVGRSGMAWGKGLHDDSLNRSPLKKEGDGKTPAGIFGIDSLYGYEDLTAKMDYLQVDRNTFCVDDPASKYYNRIVRGDEVTKDWNSAETMRMESDVYKYGIVVGYNTKPVQAGAGSCIFYHLGSPGTTTAGCTAMSEDSILKLFGFLDKQKNPLVIQAPDEAYEDMAGKYNLPPLPPKNP